MNELTTLNFQQHGMLLNDTIDRVENHSDSFIPRVMVIFKNGYKLSIIDLYLIYSFVGKGSQKGLFEIAIFSKKGYMDGSLFDKGDRGDDVLGYLSVDKVKHYIKKIGALK